MAVPLSGMKYCFITGSPMWYTSANLLPYCEPNHHLLVCPVSSWAEPLGQHVEYARIQHDPPFRAVVWGCSNRGHLIDRKSVV